MAETPTGYDQEPAPTSDTASLSVPRQIERRRVRQYQREVDAGSKAYDKWDQDFKCKDNEEYYCGFQWDQSGLEANNYVINYCAASLETRLPSLLFYNPKARIKPKPARADDPMTAVDDRAKLLEDTADSFITEEKVGFMPATQLALREAHYRFGIVQVGYTADYLDNPNIGKPMIGDDKEPMAGSDGQPVLEGPYLLKEESLYVKHIPAEQVRVPVAAYNQLEHNDWFAYYEFTPIDDVKRNPRYVNTDKIKSTAKMRREYEQFYYDEADSEAARNKSRDMVKVWRCWDLRTMTYYVWPDGGDFFLVAGDPFTFLPIADLKFQERIREYYPKPPMTDWRSPQDELNETRQMQRIHRRRFKRKYARLRNFCTAEEWDKLEGGDDGTCIEVSNLDGMRPIEDAPLDPAVARNIPNTRDDFMRVSGVGGEQMNVPQSETATQAAIIDSNNRTREVAARAVVGKWLSKVIKLMLLTARERMALPFWIERHVDPLGPAAMEEAMRVATTWAAITHQDLGEFDFDVSVDLESLTPVTVDQERQKWMQVLGLLTQPQMAVLLSGSEVLLRKTLEFYGIRGARDIAEIRGAMQATAIAMAMANGGMEGGATGPGGRKPPTTPSPGPGPTPGPGGINHQLAGQLGLAGPLGSPTGRPH